MEIIYFATVVEKKIIGWKHVKHKLFRCDSSVWMVEKELMTLSVPGSQELMIPFYLVSQVK